MRRDRTSTDRASNFEERLRVTMDSENDPEMVTPLSAGLEELPEFGEVFTLPKIFRQTNMNSRRGGRITQSQRGKDSD